MQYDYRYDRQHRMTRKTDRRSGRTMHWTYDAAGNLTTKTHYQGEVTEYQYDASSATYHHDTVGSVTGLSGHAGSVENTLSYDPFGAVQGETGHSPNRLRYTGREQDADTGLYYYRARYYDPQDGRFLSEDPLGFAAGDVNFYVYVGNNPVNYNDPSGRICIPCAAVIPPLLKAAGIGAATSVATGAAIRGGIAAAQGQDVVDAIAGPDAFALDLGVGAVGGGVFQGINIARQLPTIASGLSRSSQIRHRLSLSGATVGGGRNVAFAETTTGGATSRLIGISGRHTRPGMVNLPENTIFQAAATPASLGDEGVAQKRMAVQSTTHGVTHLAGVLAEFELEVVLDGSQITNGGHGAFASALIGEKSP